MYLFGEKFDAAAHSSRVLARIRPVLRTSSPVSCLVNVSRSLSNVIKNATPALATVERSLQGRSGSEWRAEDHHCMVSIANRSVLIRKLEWLVVVPVIAFGRGRLGSSRDFLVRLDLPERVRLIGVCLSAALVSQTISVFWAGVSMHLVSWGFRCGLAVICLLLYFKPHLVATAWAARWNSDVQSGLQNQSRNSG